MSVISVTLFISLLLALLFVAVFHFESKARAAGRRGGIDHEALLPLDDGDPPQPDSGEPNSDHSPKQS